uniref:Uncharacterized protein n=1 Tax=Oryza barthii TaxID=65489 RepID=A0A0D3GN68_9ORYZ
MSFAITVEASMKHDCSGVGRPQWPVSPTAWSKSPPEDAVPGGTTTSLAVPGGAAVDEAFNRSSQTVTGSMGTRRSSFLSKCETLCPRGRQRPSRGYCWGSIFRSQKVANRSVGLQGSRIRDSAGGKKGKAHASFGQRPKGSRRPYDPRYQQPEKVTWSLRGKLRRPPRDFGALMGSESPKSQPEENTPRSTPTS